MNNFLSKISLALVLFTAMTFTLSACGDDNPTSASENSNVEISSSSIQDNPNSSSESVKSSSSSSVKETSSSSTAKSSSSTVKSSSSISVKSSSSVASSSSSSSINVSSSSANSFSSSSRTTPPFRTINYHYDTLEYVGKKYLYMDFGGWGADMVLIDFKVMAQNLDYGTRVDGAEEQNDDTVVEKYCYNDDTTNCKLYGGLYQWAEVMGLPYECNLISCADSITYTNKEKGFVQGICPENWHIMTRNEFVAIMKRSAGRWELIDIKTTYFETWGLNGSGYTLMGAGYRDLDKTFKDLDVSSVQFYPGPEVSGDETKVAGGYVDDYLEEDGEIKKTGGVSLRCVMDY